MQFMELRDRILKQDAAGRVWTPREQREAALNEFERSGLPATRFAEGIGVKYQTFASWVKKRRKSGSGSGVAAGGEVAAVRWVEARVAEAPAEKTRALEIHLPGGARVEVADAGQALLAAQVLRALQNAGAGC